MGHIRPFTLRGLLDFLHLQNLRVLHVEGYSLDTVQELRFLDMILSKFIPLSSGFIVMAEKPRKPLGANLERRNLRSHGFKTSPE